MMQGNDRQGPHQGAHPRGAQARGAGPGAPIGPAAAGPGTERRIDALDVLEGVLTEGFSFSSLTRIARASGSSFWIGAALGAGLVVLMNRPDVRTAVAGALARSQPQPAPATPTKPPAA
jgi:hypothetical protein